MSLLSRLRDRLGSRDQSAPRIHLVLKGRIGEGWFDIDERIRVPAPATLATFLEVAERRGIAIRSAIAASPHLQHTLMLNGERCPLEENLDRPLADGDQIYLLAPLAGG